MKSFVILLVCLAVASSKPAESNDDVLGSVVGAVKSCGEKDVSLCLKERALEYVDKVNSAREISITDGISLVGSGSSRSARAYEPLAEEPQVRETQVQGRLIEGVFSFFENHSINLRMPKSLIDEVKTSVEEGRGKKKKLKQLLPIFALLQLKIQSLIPLFLGIIALAAIKGLFLAKAAVLASGLLLLKKLLSKHEQHESYEVVAHPHHEEHYSHGGGHGGGWGRSSQDAQNLAYNAYAN